jgi:hypothetical protein
MRLHHLLAAFVFIILVMFSIAATALPIAPARVELMVTASLLVAFVILWVLDDIDRGVRNARMQWSAWRLRRSWIKLVKSLTPEQLETMRDAARESGLTLERVGAMLGVRPSITIQVDEASFDRARDQIKNAQEQIAGYGSRIDPERSDGDDDSSVACGARSSERGTTGTTRAENDQGSTGDDAGRR